MTLRIKRRDISRYVEHIIDGEIGDGLLHQCRSMPCPLARFDREHLTHHISWRAPGQRRNISDALEIRAVANGAVHRLAVTARNQRCALGQGAFWDIGHKALAGIAIKHDLLILW